MTSNYDPAWHLRHRHRNAHSANRVANLLMPMLDFRSIVDFGCGDGVWLRTMKDKGAGRVLGYDGSWNDTGQLQIEQTSYRTVDLTARISAHETFDLAICLEVGEHLPERSSKTLVQSLCDHAPVILFGAAIPHQGGYRHVNERWQSYWAGAFRERGYSRFDFIRSQIWDDPEVYFWYKQNISVFVRDERQDLSDQLRSAICAKGYLPMPLDVVHSDLFETISNYDQIAFKPLLRRLPQAVIWKMRDIAETGRRRLVSSKVFPSR